MKELRMNAQGSWRRVLAMITVAAMCFTLIGVSPAFATDGSDTPNLKGVAFSAAALESPSVAMTTEPTSVAVDGKLQLAATAKVPQTEVEDLSGYTVEWKSSDEAKATVKDGVVTGVAEGEADITLTVKKGEDVVGDAQTVTITVVATTNVVDGVVFSAAEENMDSAVAMTTGLTSVVVGETLPLAATAKVPQTEVEDLSGYAVEWRSSDEAKATVKDGVVTGVAEGEADITLTVKKGEDVVGDAQTVTITVVAEAPTDVKAGVVFSAVEPEASTVEITTEPTNVTAGETLSLEAIAKVPEADLADLSDYEVKWESGDTTTATVNENGVVTGVTPGEAVITLEVKKNSETVGEKQTVTITVVSDGSENPDVSPVEVVTTVEAVKIKKAATELTVGGTEKLTAEVTVSPADAAKPAPAWNSSNDKVATVAADGTVTAIAEGTANITATAKIGDSEKTSAPCVVTVKAKPATSTTDKPAEGNKPQNTTSNAAPKVGEKKVVAGVTYQVAKNNTVTYQKPKKNAKKVTIPATVKINGKTYKVTSIAKNAFKGNKKVKTVKVGKNVTTIGASAFQNCKALTTVTLPAKTATIGKNAFANSKKLKKIVIKSTKMTKKTVKNGAFKSVSKKATIDVPNKKAKTYKKLFQKKGLPKACKVK